MSQYELLWALAAALVFTKCRLQSRVVVFFYLAMRVFLTSFKIHSFIFYRLVPLGTRLTLDTRLDRW